MSTQMQAQPAYTTGGIDDLASTISKASTATILRGVVAIVFGIASFYAPNYALSFLIALFGVYAFVDGVLALVASIRMARQHQPWLALLFLGLIGIGAGIATYRAPAMTAQTLLYVIAAWAIITGVLELAGAFAVADLFPGSWTVAVAGGLSILLGYLLLAASPASGILAIVWAIGFYAIFYGITLIYMGSQMRGLARGR
jgi:uncharacterized membrane protein HdeD (DUF308 family)